MAPHSRTHRSRRSRHSRRVRSDASGVAALAREALAPSMRIVGEHLGAPVVDLEATAQACSGPLDTAFEQVTSIEVLLAAWRTVLARDARDGELRRQTEQIAGRLDEELAGLSAALRSGRFLPAPLAQVTLPKKEEGEVRTLDIPSIRDRIVERAILDTIGQDADQVMSPCSYGYRLGLGV